MSQITILGCGSSVGTPMIGCQCDICQSDNPKNKRTRSSILIEFDDGFQLLVDTSPDLRFQALREKMTTIDALFYTHAHADHTQGIDDVRAFNVNSGGQMIHVYGTKICLDELQERFEYVWKPFTGPYVSRAGLVPHVVEYGDRITFSEKAEIQIFRQIHKPIESVGMRIGDVVYSTDLNEIPKESEPFLQNIKIWILDCLRHGESGSHTSFAQAMEWIDRYKPERVILTHMNHELEYEALKASLPSHIEPAYDGLKIAF